MTDPTPDAPVPPRETPKAVALAAFPDGALLDPDELRADLDAVFDQEMRGFDELY